MSDSRHAFLRLAGTGWRTDTEVDAVTDGACIEQRLWLSGGPGAVPPELLFRGRLDRPAFAEITEVDPLPPTGATTELRAEANVLRVEASGLPALAEIAVTGEGGAWQIEGAEARLVLATPPSSGVLELAIACTLIEP